MADSADKTDSSAFAAEEVVDDNVDISSRKAKQSSFAEEITLYGLLKQFFVAVFSSGEDSLYGSASLLQRLRSYLSQNIPLLREAFQNTARNVVEWTRLGGPFRAIFVVAVGTIAILALTGLLVFLLFFVAATINAIVVALLMSVAAAGGFLALFFAFLTAIYIGALSVAVFVISTATISAIASVIIVTGWVGFFCAVWLATKKSVGIAKNSLSATGSALSAYSSARRARHQYEVNKSN